MLTYDRPPSLGYVHAVIRALAMRTGTVEWFHENRGFGFIRPDLEERDVFVHAADIRQSGMRTLTKGQRIRFDIGEHNGRRAAVNLQLIEPSGYRSTLVSGTTDCRADGARD